MVSLVRSPSFTGEIHGKNASIRIVFGMFLGDACVMKRDVCAYSNGSRKRNAHKANLIMINDTMTILILQQLINPKFSPKPPKKKLQNSPKPTS